MHQRAVRVGVAGDEDRQIADLQGRGVEPGHAAFIERETGLGHPEPVDVRAAAERGQQQFDVGLAVARPHAHAPPNRGDRRLGTQPHLHLLAEVGDRTLAHFRVGDAGDRRCEVCRDHAHAEPGQREAHLQTDRAQAKNAYRVRQGLELEEFIGAHGAFPYRVEPGRHHRP